MATITAASERRRKKLAAKRAVESRRKRKRQEHELTQKQERFCQLIVAGEPARVAYVEAFDPRTASAKSIDEAAARVRKRGPVQARIAQLRIPAVEEAQVTLKGHLRRLGQLSARAEEREQYGAAITAEKYRGDASGFYTKKVDVAVRTPLERLVGAANDDEGKDS